LTSVDSAGGGPHHAELQLRAPNSSYARTEFREMKANGGATNWTLAGSHQLSATLRIVSVTPADR
jgi:hypothetical protein